MRPSEFTDEHLMRLCGLQWIDFVELVDMVRRGVVFWLSNAKSRNSEPEPIVTRNGSNASQTTTTTVLKEEDEDEEETDQPTALRSVTPPPSGESAAAHRRRTRLKRAQSERGPDGSLVPPPRPVLSPPAGGIIPAPPTEPGSPPPSSHSLTQSRRSNLTHSISFTAKDLDPAVSFLTVKETLSRSEMKRREALWDLFQSENAFLVDHLMVLKNVSQVGKQIANHSTRSGLYRSSYFYGN